MRLIKNDHPDLLRPGEPLDVVEALHRNPLAPRRVAGPHFLVVDGVHRVAEVSGRTLPRRDHCLRTNNQGNNSQLPGDSQGSEGLPGAGVRCVQGRPMLPDGSQQGCDRRSLVRQQSGVPHQGLQRLQRRRSLRGCRRRTRDLPMTDLPLPACGRARDAVAFGLQTVLGPPPDRPEFLGGGCGAEVADAVFRVLDGRGRPDEVDFGGHWLASWTYSVRGYVMGND